MQKTTAKANTERLYKDVEFLTELKPSRNFENLVSLNKAADYIKSEMEKCGNKTEEQTWTAKGNEYRNIILQYAPEKSKRLIIGAHYDVCCDQPGADDNASAVAGLLETARMIFNEKPDLSYGIDFVAYSLEEPPFFASHEMGSFVHAKSLHESNTEVLGMVCYEMIGYFSDEKDVQQYPAEELKSFYPETADFIIVAGIQRFKDFSENFYKKMKKDSKIDVQLINQLDAGDLVGMSDQRNYWHFNYPALMINDTSFMRNKNYHTPNDTIDTLDFDKMTEVINSSYRAIINLSEF